MLVYSSCWNVLTFPFPKVLVGVLTDMKIRSASFIAVSMSMENIRLRPRHSLTTSSSPGWNEHSHRENVIYSKHSIAEITCHRDTDKSILPVVQQQSDIDTLIRGTKKNYS